MTPDPIGRAEARINAAVTAGAAIAVLLSVAVLLAALILVTVWFIRGTL